MNRKLSDFSEEMLAALKEGRIDDVLSRVTDEVLKVIAQDDSHGRVYSCPEFDHICQVAGHTQRGAQVGARRDHSAILATAMASTGGHSRVILEIALAAPSPRTTILLTGLNNDGLEDELRGMLLPDGVDLQIAPIAGHAHRLRWCQEQLARIKPTTTYILQHHWDSIIPAVAQPDLTGKLIYYHNCDHSLALGVHIPSAIHIDFNTKSFYRCREALNIYTNQLWPLAARSSAIKPRFLNNGPLTTACCGGYEKFETPHLSRAQTYSISYDEMVQRVLSTTEGLHLHIGPLSDSMLTSISNRLSQGGIDKTAFRHIPFAPNLGQALITAGVDVYLGSMPRGGGKATVEAMAAGLPLLIHSNYRSIFMSDENEVYPGARIWRTLGELDAGLQWSKVELQQHSREALRFAQANHSPERFASALRRTLQGRVDPSLPQRPRHRPNLLQAYWDEQDA